MQLGDKIIEARKQKGYTQEELAEKCNLTSRTIQRIESNQVEPRSHTRKLILEVLDIDITDELSKKHSITWLIKDLTNIKTSSTMKISILSSIVILVVLLTLFFTTSNYAQSGSDTIYQTNDGIIIKKKDALISHALFMAKSMDYYLTNYGSVKLYTLPSYDASEQNISLLIALEANDPRRNRSEYSIYEAGPFIDPKFIKWHDTPNAYGPWSFTIEHGNEENRHSMTLNASMDELEVIEY